MNSDNDNSPHLSGGRRKLSAKFIPIPQDMSWTMGEIYRAKGWDLSSEEDSRQEMQILFQADESRDTVHRQISPVNIKQDSMMAVRDEDPPLQTSTREAGDDCPSIPYLDNNESDYYNDSPENVNLVLRRCHAWSQDSLDRRQRSPESPMTATTCRYGRSDSILIDSNKFGSYQIILEESPTTSTWVYWEEQLDNQDVTFRESYCSLGRAPIV